MSGGLVWFAAGVLVTLVAVHDLYGQVFAVVAAFLAGVVTFIAALGTMGFVGVLVLLGVGLFVGSRWAERARGAFDAKNAWEGRTKYRKG